MSTIHVHCIVRGRVQGVGFRWFTQLTAESLGVNGTVRNCADGTVKADLEGPADAVSAVIEKLHQGPSMSRVDGIETSQAPVTGISGFRVTG